MTIDDSRQFDERDDDMIRCPECNARFPYWWVEEGQPDCPECGESVEDCLTDHIYKLYT